MVNQSRPDPNRWPRQKNVTSILEILLFGIDPIICHISSMILLVRGLDGE